MCPERAHGFFERFLPAVESSLKGENPQSSVVPNCSTGIYRAASIWSRISSGVSIRGSIEQPRQGNAWIRFHVIPNDLQDSDTILFASQRDVKFPTCSSNKLGSNSA